MQATGTIAPAAPYRSAGFRARLTTSLLAVYVVEFILLGIGGFALSSLQPQNPRALDVEVALAWTSLTVVGGIFVAFCFWLYRVIDNMPALGVSGSPWTGGSAVAWCFIPGGFLVQPMWSVLDAWRGADTSAHQIDLGSRTDIKPRRLLIAWWVVWLTSLLCGLAASKLHGAAGSVLTAFFAAGFIAAALLCTLVIRDVTDRQDRKHELIASGQLV